MPNRAAPTSPLLAALSALLRRHRSALRQDRAFRRMQGLLFGHLFCFARRTVTRALVALGLTECDWSAFYRLFNEPRMDYEELSRCFLAETLPHVPEERPYVAVVDGVQVPRHSTHRSGLGLLSNAKVQGGP